jgi:hypothetical protein
MREENICLDINTGQIKLQPLNLLPPGRQSQVWPGFYSPAPKGPGQAHDNRATGLPASGREKGVLFSKKSRKNS